MIKTIMHNTSLRIQYKNIEIIITQDYLETGEDHITVLRNLDDERYCEKITGKLKEDIVSWYLDRYKFYE